MFNISDEDWSHAGAAGEVIHSYPLGFSGGANEQTQPPYICNVDEHITDYRCERIDNALLSGRRQGNRCVCIDFTAYRSKRKFDQQILGGNDISGLGMHGFDGGIALRANNALHLHGFDGD